MQRRLENCLVSRSGKKGIYEFEVTKEFLVEWKVESTVGHAGELYCSKVVFSVQSVVCSVQFAACHEVYTLHRYLEV